MSDTSSESDWTRNADGSFVRWDQPPHYVGGVLNLRLPGEDAGKMARETWSKRNREYLLLRKRSMKKRPQAGET
jgi:hypothetical protein